MELILGGIEGSILSLGIILGLELGFILRSGLGCCVGLIEGETEDDSLVVRLFVGTGLGGLVGDEEFVLVSLTLDSTSKRRVLSETEGNKAVTKLLFELEELVELF